MLDRSDALASLDSLAESFVDMAGASSFPVDDLELIDLPDADDNDDAAIYGGGHDDDGGNTCGPRTDSDSLVSLVSSKAPSPASTASGLPRTPLYPPGIPLPHVHDTSSATVKTTTRTSAPVNATPTASRTDAGKGAPSVGHQTQGSVTASTVNIECPHPHPHAHPCPHPSSSTLLSVSDTAPQAQPPNQAMPLISPLPTSRPTWLPTPPAPLPQAYLVTLAGYGVRYLPFDKKHAWSFSVDEKNVALAAVTLSSPRPESAAKAVSINPDLYAGKADLDPAMALAHAHCLLYDLFAADTRLDGDAVYASLVSRFIADVIASPAVVSVITDVDTNAKHILGLRDLPPLTSQLGASPLGPGFTLGLRSTAVQIDPTPLESARSKERLQGLTLIPLMKARELVWSTAQDTLTESWFPWLIVEANGLCGSAAHAHIRLLSGMRLALAMYGRLHAAANTMSSGKCENRSDESRAVYGLQTVGSMWQLFVMKDENGQYPVSVVWSGHIHDPKAMAYGLFFLRSIGDQGPSRLHLVTSWLACVCGESGKKVSPSKRRASARLSPPTSIPKSSSSVSKGSASPPEPLKPTARSPTSSTSPDKPPLKPWASAFQPLKPKEDKPLETVPKLVTDLLPAKLMSERSPGILYSMPSVSSSRNLTSQQTTQQLNTFNFGLQNNGFNQVPPRQQPGNGFIFPNHPPGLGNWGHDNWQQPNPMFVPRHNTNAYPLNLGPTWPPANGDMSGGLRSPPNGHVQSNGLSRPGAGPPSGNLGLFWQPPPAVGVKLAPPVKRANAITSSLTSPTLRDK